MSYFFAFHRKTSLKMRYSQMPWYIRSRLSISGIDFLTKNILTKIFISFFWPFLALVGNGLAQNWVYYIIFSTRIAPFLIFLTKLMLLIRKSPCFTFSFDFSAKDEGNIPKQWSLLYSTSLLYLQEIRYPGMRFECIEVHEKSKNKPKYRNIHSYCFKRTFGFISMLINKAKINKNAYVLT